MLRSNANYLHQSVRKYTENVRNAPILELAWTDGERVWSSLMHLSSDCGNVSSFTSAKKTFLIGEFEGFAYGVFCSSFTNGNDEYYIAVVLKEKVVILSRKIGDDVVKLVKEYSTECIAQGCSWHPSLPMLAVLSKSAAVLLSFSEDCIVLPIKTFKRLKIA